MSGKNSPSLSSEMFYRPSFTCSDVRLNSLPGWGRDSWGYHGDDGNAFASERDGKPFGPQFTSKSSYTHPYLDRTGLTCLVAGDVIGCGIDFKLSKVFYTKNGVLLGTFSHYGLIIYVVK